MRAGDKGPCYFGRDHEGTWRTCCHQFLCEYHSGRLDLRAMGAGLELATKVLNAVGIKRS